MPGTKAPRQIRAQRHQYALQRLASGTPYSTVVTEVSDQWGCSRRMARNVCTKALDEVVGDMETVEIKQLTASCIHRLERLAMRAEQCGQFAAAVGAVRTLNELVLEPSRQRSGIGRRLNG